MSKPRIGVVIPITPEGRYGDKPALWIRRIALRSKVQTQSSDTSSECLLR